MGLFLLYPQRKQAKNNQQTLWFSSYSVIQAILGQKAFRKSVQIHLCQAARISKKNVTSNFRAFQFCWLWKVKLVLDVVFWQFYIDFSSLKQTQSDFWGLKQNNKPNSVPTKFKYCLFCLSLWKFTVNVVTIKKTILSKIGGFEFHRAMTRKGEKCVHLCSFRRCSSCLLFVSPLTQTACSSGSVELDDVWERASSVVRDWSILSRLLEVGNCRYFSGT